MRLILGAVIIVSLSACTKTQFFWEYEPFETPPDKPLEQAKMICQNAALQAQHSYTAPKSIGAVECSHFLGTTRCNDSTPQHIRALEDIAAKKQRSKLANSSYVACMATHGWRASENYITTGSLWGGGPHQDFVTCKMPNGKVIDTQIMRSTCLESHQGTVIDE